MRHEKEEVSGMKTRRIMRGAMIALVIGSIVGVSGQAAERTISGNGTVWQQVETENVADRLPAELEIEGEQAQSQAENAQETEAVPENMEAGDIEEMTQEELALYFGESVFIGDSVMIGLRNYSMNQEGDSCLSGAQFLAAVGYSSYNALQPVTGKHIHPLYKGKKCQVWDAVSDMGAKRVFISLGTNDIIMLGSEGAIERCRQVVDKILESCPGVEINCISVTYAAEGKEKGKLNNQSIAEYNGLLLQMAAENGWGYLDMATPLSDGRGNLSNEICSDGFVHLKNSAYEVWEEELIRYANMRKERYDHDEQ